MKYSQPDFYHFSRDSIFLAHEASSYINKLTDINVLDLCSGCGVIGIEFSLLLDKQIKKIDFIEVQPEYKAYIEKNLQNSGLLERSNVHIQSFKDFNISSRVDVVLCNPPFYLDNKYRLSSNENKKRARAYSDGFPQDVLSFIDRLSPKYSFLVLKDDIRDWEKKLEKFKYKVISKESNMLIYLKKLR